MSDFYMFERMIETNHIPELGKDISWSAWIKNWRQEVFVRDYWDYQIADIEDNVAIIRFLHKNEIPYCIDGCWMYYVCNRWQCNKLRQLINEELEKIYSYE